MTLSLSAHAQGPLLIKEVIFREVGLFNGQGPDNQVISREVSMYVEWGRDNQVISREYSLVMVNAAPPPIVSNTVIVATASPSGHTVTLDWSAYNQWAVRDVSYYAIYYSLSPFTSVTGMTPYVIIPGETLSATFTGLTEWVDHFFAVVPVDGLGNFEPNILYKGVYVLMPQVISRETGLFIGQGPDKQVISREYSLNYVDTNAPPRINNTDITMTVSPRGDTVSVNWSPYNQWAVRDVAHYAIYYALSPFTSVTGMTPFAIIPGETLSTTFTGLTEWVDHYFAVVPVDGLGHFDPDVLYRAAYVLFPQMISREVGLFIGQGPDKQVISREYTFVRGDTNIPAAVTYSGSPYNALASSNAYGAIDLDWSFYNEWAERDIVRYRIYVSTQFFDNVEAMTPHAFSTNGKLIDTITNLPCEEILYTAVVAEDTLGQFDPVVFSRSSKASVCELGEVSNLVANATYDSIQYNWDLGGIGTDLRFFIDYFRVYFNGSLTPVVVPGTNFTWTATGLMPGEEYPVRITTVDMLGTESAGAFLTTALPSFFLGEVSGLSVEAAATRLTWSWSFNPATNLLDRFVVYFEAQPPISLSTQAVTWTATGLQPGHTYDFRISTVDTFGQESPGVALAGTTRTVPILHQPPPVLVITNPVENVILAASVDGIDLAGIAQHGRGSIAWTNHLTLNAGEFPYETPWSVTNLALDVGINPVEVSMLTATSFYALAHDHAADPAYAGGWVDGSNGGEGFEPWTFYTSSTDPNRNGRFIGDGGPVGNPAWGLYANNGHLSVAFRRFEAPLEIGRTVSLHWRHSAVGAGGMVGVTLHNSESQFLVNFLYDISQPFYVVGDSLANGGTLSRTAITTDGLHVSFTRVSHQNVQLRFVTPEGETHSYTLEMVAHADQAPAQILIWNLTAGAGPPHDVFFNDLRLTEPVPGSSVLATDTVHITRLHPSGDTNQDGIPDDWYLGHSLNPAVPGLALLDPDGDGQTTGYEFVVDTDPTDGQSFFPPLNLPTLLWLEVSHSSTNRYYELQGNPEIRDPFGWHAIAPEVIGTGTNLLFEVDPELLPLFLRIKIRLP